MVVLAAESTRRRRARAGEERRGASIVPVDGSGEGRVALGVGGVPSEPQCSQLFDDFGVAGPAVGIAGKG